MLPIFLAGHVFMIFPVLEHDVLDFAHAKFEIPYLVDAKDHVDLIRVFVSRDRGKSWKHDTSFKPGEKLRFHASEDGHYWFAVQVVLKDGQNLPRMVDLSASLKVFVNTQRRPIIQLRQTEDEVAKLFEARRGIVVRNKEGKIANIGLRPFSASDFNQIDFSVFKDVEVLSIHGNEVTDELLVRLQSLPVGLKLLDMRFIDAPITDEALAGLLRKQTSLKVVMLTATPVTDKTLSELGKLKGLQSLTLDQTKITDKGLKNLANLKLSVLTLKDTKISNAGLRELKGMVSLRWLDLEGTNVSDMGIQSLSELKELGLLGIDATKVTEAGKQVIRAALPDVEFLQRNKAPK